MQTLKIICPLGSLEQLHKGGVKDDAGAPEGGNEAHPDGVALDAECDHAGGDVEVMTFLITRLFWRGWCVVKGDGKPPLKLTKPLYLFLFSQI